MIIGMMNGQVLLSKHGKARKYAKGWGVHANRSIFEKTGDGAAATGGLTKVRFVKTKAQARALLKKVDDILETRQLLIEAGHEIDD